MAIPSASTTAAQLLCELGCGDVLSLHDLRHRLAESFDLSADERLALINPDSKETKFGNRVGHARTLLVRLGLANQPARSALQISAEGIAVLEGDRTPRSGMKNATSGGLYRALDEIGDRGPAAGAAASSPISSGVDREVDGTAPDEPVPYVDADAVEPVREPDPEPAAALVPGPRALGRSIVLALGDRVPEPWEGMPEIAVSQADLQRRTAPSTACIASGRAVSR